MLKKVHAEVRPDPDGQAPANQGGKMPEQISVTMHKDKVTKNSVRYQAPKVGDDPHTKNIYLTIAELKEHFGDIPETLNVVITVPGA